MNTALLREPRQVPELIKTAKESKVIHRAMAFSPGLLFLVCTFIGLPLCMGGYLFGAHAIAGCAAATLVFSLAVTGKLDPSKWTVGLKYALYALAATALYAIVQGVVFSRLPPPFDHPLSSDATRLVHPAGFLQYITSAATLTMFLVLVAHEATVGSDRLKRWVIIGLSASGTLCSLIGILHWFSDSGIFFGIFEPESIIASRRMRWPFVNANHFAAFLLLCSCASWALLGNARAALEIEFGSHPGRITSRHEQLTKIINRIKRSPQAQIRVWRFSIMIVCCAIQTIGIAGSGSRAAWCALSVAAVLYWLLMPRSSRRPPRTIRFGPVRRLARESIPSRLRRLSHSAWEKVAEWLLRAIAIAAPVGLLLVFLQGTALDLVHQRLVIDGEYLTVDPRWTLYGSALGWLYSNPLFGIGAGQWASLFRTLPIPSLASVSVPYLHSDILQSWVELGTVGSLPGAIFSFWLIRGVIRGFRLAPSVQSNAWVMNRRRTAGIVAGMTAIIICALFDFPFRIPAISCGFVIALGLLLSDLAEMSHHREAFDRGSDEDNATCSLAAHNAT